MVAKLDKAGRLVVPKAWRDRLHLRPGEPLEIELVDDAIVLKPALRSVHLRRKNGLWTFNSGSRSTAEDTRRMIEEARSEREATILGRRGRD